MRSRALWMGVLGGIVASLLIGLFAVPASGVIEMTATGSPGFLDWWGDTNWKSSVVWRAPDTKMPASADAAKGQEHFAAMCLQCHGAPDVPPAEWSRSMQPMPPKLWEQGIQQMGDGTLFYIIKNGVRMTGMPAFADHSEDDLWNLVAFVRQLDDLTDDQTRALRTAATRYQHHHGHGHDHGGHKHGGHDHAGPPSPHDEEPPLGERNATR